MKNKHTFHRLMPGFSNLFPIAITALLLVTAIFSSQAACRDEEAKKISIRYAARQAVKVAVEKVLENDPRDFIPEISSGISENPNAHKTAEESRTLVEDDLRVLLLRSLEQDLKRIHQSLNPPDESSRWFTLEWLKEECEEKFGEKCDTQIEIYTERRLSKIFQDARKQAIDRQLEDLAEGVYPTEEEIEHIETAGWNSELMNALKTKVKKSIHPQSGVSLLEEVEKETASFADVIIADVQNQIINQRKALDAPIPHGIILPSDIYDHVQQNVESARKRYEQKAEPHQNIFGIFSFIESEIQTTSRRKSGEFFRDYCESFKFEPEEQTIKNIILKNTAAHQSYNDSVKLCAKHFFPFFLDSAISSYASRISNPEEKDNFTVFLRNLAESNQEVRSSIKKRLGSAVRRPLEDVREVIARKQLQEYFKPLDEGTWKLSENYLKKVRHENFGVHSFEQCLDLPFIMSPDKRYDAGILLDDAQNLVLSTTKKLISEGERAWEGQSDLVKKYEDIVRGEVYRDHKSRTVGQWIAHYTDNVEKEWAKDRMSLIWGASSNVEPYASVKYSSLFGYMKEQIEKNVRNYFQEALKIEEARIARIKREEELEKQRREEARREKERIEKARREREELEKRRREEEAKLKREREKQERESGERDREEQMEAAGKETSMNGNAGGSGFETSQTSPGVAGGPKDTADKGGGGEAKEGTGNKGGQGAAGAHIPRYIRWGLILLIVLLLCLWIWTVLASSKIRIPVADLEEGKIHFEALFGMEPFQETDEKVVYKNGKYSLRRYILVRKPHRQEEASET